MSDVPAACRAICGPVGALSRQCETDLRSDVDRDERLLEAQCVCTNRSFDVQWWTARCADCFRQDAAANGTAHVHPVPSPARCTDARCRRRSERFLNARAQSAHANRGLLLPPRGIGLLDEENAEPPEE